MSDAGNLKHGAVNIGLSIPSLYCTAWALTYGWHLFVEPLGVPGIGKAQALGLIAIGTLLSGAWGIFLRMPEKKQTKEEELWISTTMLIFKPIILFFVFFLYGWLGTL